MLDFHPLFEFSRAHCIAICAFLVTMNALLTVLTITLTAFHRPQRQVWKVAAIACIPALVMVLHVFTWFTAGVVMLPTYILLWFGSSCLIANFWAILHPQSVAKLLRSEWV